MADEKAAPHFACAKRKYGQRGEETMTCPEAVRRLINEAMRL